LPDLLIEQGLDGRLFGGRIRRGGWANRRATTEDRQQKSEGRQKQEPRWNFHAVVLQRLPRPRQALSKGLLRFYGIAIAQDGSWRVRPRSMPRFESVLIVDDNRNALTLLGQLLSALGVKRVYPVASAEEALDVLEEESFSIILSDYRLEGMDGVEFLDRLRRSGNNTPVMILSGAPDPKDVIRASTYERVDFFPKPFRIAELTGAMDRLLAA
jgi:CheY-like chemotaxis protein